MGEFELRLQGKNANPNAASAVAGEAGPGLDAETVRGIGGTAAQPLVGELPSAWEEHYGHIKDLHVSAEKAHETGYAD